MSNNRHKITIRAPKPGTVTYLIPYFQITPIFVTWNPSTKQWVDLDETYVFDEESISTSKIKDQYRNKECHHTYAEMTAQVIVPATSGLTATQVVYEPLPEYKLYRGTTLVSGIYVPGKGKPDSWGYYDIVTVATSSRFECESYTPDGRKKYTRITTVESIKLASLPTSRPTVIYRERYIYEYWYLKANNFRFANTDTTFTRSVTPVLCGTSIGFSLSSYHQVFRDVLDYRKQGLSHYVPDDFVDDLFDKLAIPDVNNVENLIQLRQFKKSLPPILALLRKRNIKSLAEFYLWYKYTYKTTCMDLNEYLRFFIKWSSQNPRKDGKAQTVLTYDLSEPTSLYKETRICRYRIYHDTYNLGVLQALGLDLNLANMWDVVPFSFVVDWFVNLGDMLARLDHSDIASQIKVHSVMTSTKCTRVYYPLSAYGCYDPCYVVKYRRSIDKTLPLGNYSISLKNPAAHITDAAALFVALKA